MSLRCLNSMRGMILLHIFLELLILVVLAVVVFFILHISTAWQGYEYKTFIIDGNSKKLLLAETEEQKQKGLMWQFNLLTYDGMAFLYKEPQVATFWNKNTFMNLKLYWYKNGEIIGTSMLPSVISTKGEVKTVQSPSEVDVVVEIPN